MRTGIDGLDEITHGGLPRGRTTLVKGGAGSGKTVLALQSLANGIRQRKEAGIFVAFEESSGQIQANATTFDWDLASFSSKKLFFLDALVSPEVIKTGEFDLSGMLHILRAKASEIQATCIVFDGIDVLLGLLDDPAAERREIYRIRDWLSTSHLTAIITQKVGEPGVDGRYAFLQFMVDCVILLGHEVVDGAAYRNLRVSKYRGSAFLADEFPIVFTETGMELASRGPGELQYSVTNQRISSGVTRLDTMLRGGYHRGSNVLISGSPGTAKSTLSGLFVAAACGRGERSLYVSFDEGSDQIVRNLRSVGVHLAPHLRSGILKMFSTRTQGANIGDQFRTLRTLVGAHKPRCLVVDPLSALARKSVHRASVDVAQQFLDYLKVEGITVVNTSLIEGLSSDEATATGISTIADTWIHLSYLVQDGERNRALTIVKSRGTRHSNQVREMTLSDAGVTLKDVFAVQGKVLMGVARWEREREEQEVKRRSEEAAGVKRKQLQRAQVEATVRLQAIHAEMEARHIEIGFLADATGSASKRVKSDRATLRRMRHADTDVFRGKLAAGREDVGKSGKGHGH
jgi:circadian clock protein KaiC